MICLVIDGGVHITYVMVLYAHIVPGAHFDMVPYYAICFDYENIFNMFSMSTVCFVSKRLESGFHIYVICFDYEKVFDTLFMHVVCFMCEHFGKWFSNLITY